MATCIRCKEKIKNNQYEMRDSKVYCKKCIEELKDQKEVLEAKAAEIIEPTEAAKQALVEQGIKLLESPKKCSKCGGTGKLQYDDGDRYLDDICDECNGTGQVE